MPQDNNVTTNPPAAQDFIRVLRIVQYEGPREWVERTVTNAVHNTRIVGPGKRITACTLGAFGESIGEPKPYTPDTTDPAERRFADAVRVLWNAFNHLDDALNEHEEKQRHELLAICRLMVDAYSVSSRRIR